MPLNAGTRLGPYEIVAPLGAGGMGEVYKARDTRLDRVVAIKILREHLASDPDRRARFDREARTISKLNHPNICTLYDVGREIDTDYLVVEYLEGETLANRLQNGPLPIDQAVQYAIQIADALDTAHGAGIIHRDLKPANVMLTKAGAKLLDFGIAKAISPSKDGQHVPISDEVASGSAASLTGAPTLPLTLTVEGALLGTPQYMAPEQLEGREIDARSDVFAFGAMLYEMLTGRRAFEGESQSRIAAAVLDSQPPPVSSVRPLVPASLARIVTACLAKDPDERLQSAGDVVHSLKSAIDDANEAGTIAALRRRPWYVAWLVGAVVLAAATVAGIVYVRRAPALTERDTILLTDVTNTTGDSLFDGTLKQALAVKLDESPYLNVAADASVQQTLRLMGRSPDERLTEVVGREVCQRESIKAMLTGSIATLGSRYVITLNAVNCQTGDSIARAQEEAANKESVLRALGAATMSLRRKLGESLASIQKFDAPLQDATTSSLDALKADTRGIALLEAAKPAEAVPLFRHAIELDPDFADAYYFLSVAYFSLGEPALRRHAFTRAYELRDRVTERERLQIVARYHQLLTGDMVKMFEAFTLLHETYPRDVEPYNALGLFYYSQLGQFDRAADQFREEVRLRPENVVFLTNLARAYVNLNRLDEAKALLEQSVARKRESPVLHLLLGDIGYLQRDEAAAGRHLEWVKQRDPRTGFSVQAQRAYVAGKLHDAHELRVKSADVSGRAGRAEATALDWVSMAVAEASFGFGDAARRDVAEALRLAPTRDVTWQSAVVLAQSGFAKDAQPLLERTLKDYPPTDTLTTAVRVPQIRAALDLTSGNATAAIDELATAVPYDARNFPIMYLRGSAYLAANRPTDATAEFQKLVDRARTSVTFFVPLARLGIARALAKSGRTAESRTAYQDFLSAWKDADNDIPILVAAKQEYARLK